MTEYSDEDYDMTAIDDGNSIVPDVPEDQVTDMAPQGYEDDDEDDEGPQGFEDVRPGDPEAATPMPSTGSPKRDMVRLTMAAKTDPDTAQAAIDSGDITLQLEAIQANTELETEDLLDHIAMDDNLTPEARAELIMFKKNEMGKEYKKEVSEEVAGQYAAKITNFYAAQDELAQEPEADTSAYQRTLRDTEGQSARLDRMFAEENRETTHTLMQMHEQKVNDAQLIQGYIADKMSEVEERTNSWGDRFGAVGTFGDYAWFFGDMMLGEVPQQLYGFAKTAVTRTGKGTERDAIWTDIYATRSLEEAKEKIDALEAGTFRDQESIEILSMGASFTQASKFNYNFLQLTDAVTFYGPTEMVRKAAWAKTTSSAIRSNAKGFAKSVMDSTVAKGEHIAASSKAKWWKGDKEVTSANIKEQKPAETTQAGVVDSLQADRDFLSGPLDKFGKGIKERTPRGAEGSSQATLVTKASRENLAGEVSSLKKALGSSAIRGKDTTGLKSRLKAAEDALVAHDVKAAKETRMDVDGGKKSEVGQPLDSGLKDARLVAETRLKEVKQEAKEKTAQAHLHTSDELGKEMYHKEYVDFADGEGYRPLRWAEETGVVNHKDRDIVPEHSAKTSADTIRQKFFDANTGKVTKDASENLQNTRHAIRFNKDGSIDIRLHGGDLHAGSIRSEIDTIKAQHGSLRRQAEKLAKRVPKGDVALTTLYSRMGAMTAYRKDLEAALKATDDSIGISALDGSRKGTTLTRDVKADPELWGTKDKLEDPGVPGAATTDPTGSRFQNDYQKSLDKRNDYDQVRETVEADPQIDQTAGVTEPTQRTNPFVRDVDIIAADLAHQATGDYKNAAFYRDMAKLIKVYVSSHPNYNPARTASLPWFMKSLPVLTRRNPHGTGVFEVRVPAGPDAEDIKVDLDAANAMEEATRAHNKEFQKPSQVGVSPEEIRKELKRKHGVTIGKPDEHIIFSLFSPLGKLFPRKKGNKGALPLGRTPDVYIPSKALMTAAMKEKDSGKRFAMLRETILADLLDYLKTPDNEGRTTMSLPSVVKNDKGQVRNVAKTRKWIAEKEKAIDKAVKDGKDPKDISALVKKVDKAKKMLASTQGWEVVEWELTEQGEALTKQVLKDYVAPGSRVGTLMSQITRLLGDENVAKTAFVPYKKYDVSQMTDAQKKAYYKKREKELGLFDAEGKRTGDEPTNDPIKRGFEKKLGKLKDGEMTYQAALKEIRDRLKSAGTLEAYEKSISPESVDGPLGKRGAPEDAPSAVGSGYSEKKRDKALPHGMKLSGENDELYKLMKEQADDDGLIDGATEEFTGRYGDIDLFNETGFDVIEAGKDPAEQLTTLFRDLESAILADEKEAVRRARDIHSKRNTKEAKATEKALGRDVEKIATGLARMFSDDGMKGVHWSEIRSMDNHYVGNFMQWLEGNKGLDILEKTQMLAGYKKSQRHIIRELKKWEDRAQKSTEASPNMAAVTRHELALESLISFYAKLEASPELRVALQAGTVYLDDVAKLTPEMIHGLTEIDSTLMDPINKMLGTRKDMAMKDVKEIDEVSTSLRLREAELKATDPKTDPNQKIKQAPRPVSEERPGKEKANPPKGQIEKAIDAIPETLEDYRSKATTSNPAVKTEGTFRAMLDKVVNITKHVMYNKGGFAANTLEGEGLEEAIHHELQMRRMNKGNYHIVDSDWSEDGFRLETLLTTNDGRGWDTAQDAQAFLDEHGLTGLGKVLASPREGNKFLTKIEVPVSPDNQPIQDYLREVYHATNPNGAVETYGTEGWWFRLGNATRILGEHVHTAGLISERNGAAIGGAMDKVYEDVMNANRGRHKVFSFMNKMKLSQKEFTNKHDFEAAFDHHMGSMPMEGDWEAYNKFIDAGHAMYEILLHQHETHMKSLGATGYSIPGWDNHRFNGRRFDALPKMDPDALTDTLIIDRRKDGGSVMKGDKYVASLKGMETEEGFSYVEMSVRDLGKMASKMSPDNKNVDWDFLGSNKSVQQQLKDWSNHDGAPPHRVFIKVRDPKELVEHPDIVPPGRTFGGVMKYATRDIKDGTDLRFLKVVKTHKGKALGDSTLAQVHMSKADEAVGTLRAFHKEVQGAKAGADRNKLVNKLMSKAERDKNADLQFVWDMFAKNGDNLSTTRSKIYMFFRDKEFHVTHTGDKESASEKLGITSMRSESRSIDNEMMQSTSLLKRSDNMRFVDSSGQIDDNPVLENPLLAMAEQFENTARNRMKDRYVKQAIDMFVGQFGDLYHLDGHSDDLWFTSPVRALEAATLRNKTAVGLSPDVLRLRAQAERVKKVLISQLAAGTKDADRVDAMIHSMLGSNKDWIRIAGSSPAVKKVLHTLGTPGGIRFLSLNYRFAWNPAQIFRQRQGMVGIVSRSDSPVKEMLKDLGKGVQFEYYHSLKNDGIVGPVIEKVLHFHKGFSDADIADMDEMMEVFDTSGIGMVQRLDADMEDYRGNTAGRKHGFELDDSDVHMKDDKHEWERQIGKKIAGFNRAGIKFYTWGESHTVPGFVHAFQRQKREILKEHGVFRPDMLDFDRLHKEVDDFSQHMTGASKGDLQRGWPAALATFFTWRHNLTHQFMHESTGKQRARMLGAYSVLYGVPSALALGSGYNLIAGTGKQEQVDKAMEDVLGTTFGRLFTMGAIGTLTNSHGQDLMDDPFVGHVMRFIMDEPEEAILQLSGVPGGVIKQAWGLPAELFNFVKGEGARFNTTRAVAGLGSWASMATRASVLAWYHEYYTTKGRALGEAGAYNALDSIKLLLTGSQPRDIEKLGSMYGSNKRLRDAKKSLLNDASTALSKAYHAKARGDMGTFQSYLDQYEQIAKIRPGIFSSSKRLQHLKKAIKDVGVDKLEAVMEKSAKLTEEFNKDE